MPRDHKNALQLVKACHPSCFISSLEETLLPLRWNGLCRRSVRGHPSDVVDPQEDGL
jgi:hypothetical protein